MEYKYSSAEKVIMAFFTGASNFSCVPCLLLMVSQNRIYEFYLGVFTMLTSFMYHVSESLDYSIYIEPGLWHKLDNIGSICCFNSVLISLSSFYKDSKLVLKLNLFSLFFVMILQEADPWNLLNTIIPIAIYASILLFDFFVNGLPKYNSNAMSKGLGIFLIAISMFIKGLDEHSDYLRIGHSLWHISIGVSSFYLGQVQEKKFITIFEILRFSEKLKFLP